MVLGRYRVLKKKNVAAKIALRFEIDPIAKVCFNEYGHPFREVCLVC